MSAVDAQGASAYPVPMPRTASKRPKRTKQDDLTPWQKQDRARQKPRVSVVMTPEGKDMADELAAARGLSLSVLVEQLVRAEFKKVNRTP